MCPPFWYNIDRYIKVWNLLLVIDLWSEIGNQTSWFLMKNCYVLSWILITGFELSYFHLPLLESIVINAKWRVSVVFNLENSYLPISIPLSFPLAEQRVSDSRDHRLSCLLLLWYAFSNNIDRYIRVWNLLLVTDLWFELWSPSVCSKSPIFMAVRKMVWNSAAARVQPPL